MEVRDYQEADISAISQLYYNTVHRVNACDYNRQQIEAWAPAIEE